MKIIDILKEIINNKVKRRYILLFLLLLLLFLTGIVTTFVVVYKNRDVEFQKNIKRFVKKRDVISPIKIFMKRDWNVLFMSVKKKRKHYYIMITHILLKM
ncbi:hypothetical protein HMPREF0554_0154 [Pseudoleptotrichia goodfellowii F0264]|uniref:Uncharacterized protein n=1 Tax=Pseudoleptotrichia goodfellowii F0264 TaxID=596323 RepID=D0GIV6_9FUSO|nr:hypothetical protein HMPREF0554_0154 [Pseudoleptotrichia goodfellowii F0264]